MDSGDSLAGPNVRLCNAFNLHRIVVKRHRVHLLKDRPKILFDLLIARRPDEKLAAVSKQAELSLLDHDFPALDHVPRMLE